MYPVSLDYREKIKSDDRLFECKIQIEHSQGTLYLTDKDLVLGSLSFTEATQPGEEFTTGGTVASDISFTILNKPEYEDIKFIEATVFVNIGLQTYEGIDAHFLQPSQPSKMKGFDEKWEYVPLGIFHIDDVNRQRNTIEIKAIDNMIKFERPYSLSQLTYPATLYQIYVDACNVCGIPIGTTSFTNMNYVVQEKPEGDYNFRDIIGYVAELAGCFAKCNRHGAIELRWYEETDLIIEPNNRSNFKHNDDLIQIKGVMVTVEDKTYITGTDDYAIDLTENPLLQGDYETVLSNIYNNVKDTVFTPYTSDWQGNPAIQAGDIIKQIDRDGKEYNTLVTKSVYKYRGRSVLEGRGLPELTKGYKGTVEKFKSTANKQIAQAKNIAEEAKEIGEEAVEQISLVEQARTNVNNLMANMLGGYYIEDKENGITYIADSPNLNQATKIWRWGLGGFGYSDDGGQTWKTAITADGSIVAMLVAANIITADMIQAGKLTSQNGQVIFDLDNNDFRTPNIVMNKDGITVSNGAIVVKDANNASIITSNGLKMKYVFISSGELNGWQRCGIWIIEGWGNKHSASITVAIPEEFSIETALLKTKSMPRYFTGWSPNIPDGFYHPRNLRLYKVNTSNDGYVDFPAHSEYGVVMGGAGKTNITNAVWGVSSWSPTGSTIQVREGDVKNYLQPGTNTFLVETTDALNDNNARYGGAMQFELIVTGYLRG